MTWPRPVAGSSIPLDLPIPCRVYWIYAPHPLLARRVLVYVGECVDTIARNVRHRFAEHLEDKPWGDTIGTRDYDQAIADGTLVVSDGTYPNKGAVREAERLAIIAGRPLYNVDHNLSNPLRISKWDQAAQRAQRDRDNNVPVHRTWAAVYGDRPVVWWRKPLVWWKRQRRRTRRRILRAAGWALLALAGAVAAFALTTLSLLASLTFGAGTVVTGVLWLNRPYRRRKVEYALNQLARWAVATATAATVADDLWKIF